MLFLLLTCGAPALATEILATVAIVNVSPDTPTGKFHCMGSIMSIRMLRKTGLLF